MSSNSNVDLAKLLLQSLRAAFGSRSVEASKNEKAPTEPGRWGLSSGGWREAEGTLRCHAKDPSHHFNNTSEFQQAAYLGNHPALVCFAFLVCKSELNFPLRAFVS